jgi:hypothetical protein
VVEIYRQNRCDGKRDLLFLILGADKPNWT